VSDPLKAGIELTLSTMLQSPYFLYRVERSRAVGPEGLVALDGWEIAARLSYALWNTTPPDDLLLAAETGQLDTREGVLERAALMIEDPRATDMVVDFHNQLLHTNAYADIKKQPGMFPEFGADTGRHMQTEAELFVEDVVFGTGAGGFTQLLTATHTFVNAELSVFYGLDPAGFGETFERVELDPAQRSGLLTRLGFLADRSTLTQPDPIHRGVLVAQRIICADLPPPPPGVTALPLTTAPTNRERVDLHTGVGTCGEGCHSAIINPAGFPFEHYDAIGRFRLEDNGYPVNAADTYLLDGVDVAYADALEFSQVLSQSLQVHRCYVNHWFEYLFGRDATGQDQPLVDEVAAASLSGELSIEEILGAMLASDAFLMRVPDEEVEP
jgi:hypothetical protein